MPVWDATRLLVVQPRPVDERQVERQLKAAAVDRGEETQTFYRLFDRGIGVEVAVPDGLTVTCIDAEAGEACAAVRLSDGSGNSTPVIGRCLRARRR